MWSLAGPTRFELATSSVTDWHSNQLNYDPFFYNSVVELSTNIALRFETTKQNCIIILKILLFLYIFLNQFLSIQNKSLKICH